MALSVLLSAWLLGTIGSVHCLGMCGGFVAAAAARDGATRKTAPLLPASAMLRRQLVYHAGRVSCYAALGAAFGAAGAAALQMTALLPLQRSLFLLANGLLLALGVSLAAGTPGFAGLQRAGAAVFARVLPAVQPILSLPGASGRLALGFVWGLVPCGLVYSVLPLALFAGGIWQGALVMLAFGAGTVPALAAAGLALRLPGTVLGGRRWRYLAGAIVIAFALAGLYRTVFASDALAHGPFCPLG
ncbi:MAG TPA: sulfite exporter TauE/SafE family protein [Casimicrobiaceae bacterium]|nr:sulfite exporter TauE/SafE family protein [Casimicrobiaceae bacterium]